MKDAIKVILELIKLGKELYKTYRKEKDVKRRKDIKKAIEDRDLDRLRDLHLGRK